MAQESHSPLEPTFLNIAGDFMDESVEQWASWVEQSLKLDTGYPKIRVTASQSLKADVNVRKSGNVFEVDLYAPIRNQPERFKEAYDSALRAILSLSSE